MTQKLTLEQAQNNIDLLLPNKIKLLSYSGNKKKCDFIWLETGDMDSFWYFKAFELKDRFPPSLRQEAFDRRKKTFEYRSNMVKERCCGEAVLLDWNPKRYKMTIQWQSGEIQIIGWRSLIDSRKTRIYPASTELERQAATNMERYGAIAPAASLEIGLRIARSSNRYYAANHWETNEELVCQGSYEYAVVQYLNENKISFQWQPRTFQLSTGKTYRPDLFLTDDDLWVEIKGYFRADARIKWAEFQQICPNSVLWDTKYLKDKKIIK